MGKFKLSNFFLQIAAGCESSCPLLWFSLCALLTSAYQASSQKVRFAAGLVYIPGNTRGNTNILSRPSPAHSFCFHSSRTPALPNSHLLSRPGVFFFKSPYETESAWEIEKRLFWYMNLHLRVGGKPVAYTHTLGFNDTHLLRRGRERLQMTARRTLIISFSLSVRAWTKPCPYLVGLAGCGSRGSCWHPKECVFSWVFSNSKRGGRPGGLRKQADNGTADCWENCWRAGKSIWESLTNSYFSGATFLINATKWTLHANCFLYTPRISPSNSQNSTESASVQIFSFWHF